MYPLSDGYLQAIQNFIDRLKAHSGFEVRVNGMSTQLFGDYDAVWSILPGEIKQSYQETASISFVVKVLGVDVSKYTDDSAQ